ncbi:MAG: hypothetical protein ACE5NA_13125 [Nitrospiraceae bacterium]
MSEHPSTVPAWELARSHLCQQEPEFYELESGGALALDLGDEGWLLEITPDGRMICQMGMDMEDVQSLLSGGTPEDLGTDELAKQAKYYLQPAAGKVRAMLVGAGFKENIEMTDQYVAVTFDRLVDFANMEGVVEAIRWCQRQFKEHE